MMTSLFTRLSLRGRMAADRLRPLAAVATRVVVGQTFLLTGLGKLGHLDRTAAFFGSIGLPLPGVNAVVVGTVELLGGLCLILGLGTRLFGALLSGTMVVALLTADRGRFLQALVPGGAFGLADVSAFVLLLFLVWLIALGGGPLSLDRVFARRR